VNQRERFTSASFTNQERQPTRGPGGVILEYEPSTNRAETTINPIELQRTAFEANIDVQHGLIKMDILEESYGSTGSNVQGVLAPYRQVADQRLIRDDLIAFSSQNLAFSRVKFQGLFSAQPFARDQVR